MAVIDIAVVETGVRMKRKPAVAVRAPFSEAFAQALKKAVPQEDREFRFKTGSWVVLKKYRYEVEQLVLRFFGEFMRAGDNEHAGEVVNRDGTALKQETLAL